MQGKPDIVMREQMRATNATALYHITDPPKAQKNIKNPAIQLLSLHLTRLSSQQLEMWH